MGCIDLDETCYTGTVVNVVLGTDPDGRREVLKGLAGVIALLWLLALVTIGTLMIMSRSDVELTAGPGAPPRNALLYTVNVLLKGDGPGDSRRPWFRCTVRSSTCR